MANSYNTIDLTIYSFYYFPYLDGEDCKLSEILVDVPATSIIIVKGLKWLHGVYDYTVNEKNVTSWLNDKDTDDDDVYIWKGTNPDHGRRYNRWNINRDPFTNDRGK